jgi:hypothetical protein
VKYMAVTTFNKAGYDLYGKRFIETFREHWPEQVDLLVMSEGFDGDVDLLDASPWLRAFKARHKGKQVDSYRKDAVRFAHKVAAITWAAALPGIDRLIWLDGDMVTHSPVTLADLRELSPDGGVLAWLDRRNMYPECGFMIFDCNHPRYWELIAEFGNQYCTDRLFDLPEWHDSYVLQQVVKAGRYPTKSLSGAGYDTGHPMINGPLGAWFDHLKGKRKQAGKSSPRDLKVKRKEGYWASR